MVKRESQDQSASISTFSFTEAGKLQNIHFPEKAFSLSFYEPPLLLRGTVSQIVIYCSRVCQLEQHFPAFFQIKLKCSFFNCTLFEDEPQILHFT